MITVRRSIVKRTRTSVTRGIVVIGCVAAVCLLAYGVKNRANTGVLVHSMDASWAYSYGSIAEMKGAADAVVYGSFVNTGTASRTSDGIPFTDFQFQVSSVLYNPRSVLTDTTITIHQTGGVFGSQEFEIADDPLFRQGEQSVLFLRRIGQNNFTVLNPQGRFTVEGDLVHAASEFHIQAFTGSVPLDQFLASIRNG